MKRRFLSLALSALMLFSLSACGGQEQQDSTSAPSQMDTNTPPNTESEPEIEPEAEPEAEPEDAPDERGIKGSHGTDIRMGLTQFGLEEAAIAKAPEEAREVFAFSSSTSYRDDDSGVTYDYSLTMDSNFQIIGASFRVTNNSVPKEIFLTIASLYLGFAATMPYEAASPADARSWVEENINHVPSENEISTTIGDAKFELSGSETIGDRYGSLLMDVSKTFDEPQIETAFVIPESIEFTGTGDDVLELAPYDGIYVFYITGNAAGNHFSVTTYDENGNYGELLVNTTDPYIGMVLEEAQSAAMLEISATGDWKITQTSVYGFTPYKAGDTISGTGDGVFRVVNAGKTAQITGNSEGRHFAVHGYGATSSDLLVNTTDPYEGTVMLKCDPVLMTVNAVGEWSITLN